MPSGRTIDGSYDNGGRLHDVTYPEGAVALFFFDNTDRVGTLSRTSATDHQAIAFSYDGFLTTRRSPLPPTTRRRRRSRERRSHRRGFRHRKVTRAWLLSWPLKPKMRMDDGERRVSLLGLRPSWRGLRFLRAEPAWERANPC